MPLALINAIPNAMPFFYQYPEVWKILLQRFQVRKRVVAYNYKKQN
jgi:hypothetical protein